MLDIGWGAGAIADYPWHLDRTMPWNFTDMKNAIEIMKALPELGVKFIDTAHRYGRGLSETIIGESDLNGDLDRSIDIITKVETNSYLPKMDDDFQNSKLRLNGRMNGLLIHNPDLSNAFDFWKVCEWMHAKKTDHNLKWIGISTEPSRHAVRIVKENKLDAIQFPYSIFDRRAEDEIFPFIDDSVMTIVNRVLGGPEIEKSNDAVSQAIGFIRNVRVRISLVLFGTTKSQHLKTCVEALRGNGGGA